MKKISIALIIASFWNVTARCQSLNFTDFNVYLREREPNLSCGITKYRPTGVFNRSSSDFNGKPQYERTITGISSGSFVCVTGVTNTIANLAINKYYIRWVDNAWRLIILETLSPETYVTVQILTGNGPFPTCGSFGGAITGGTDCYCQTSMTLTGIANSTSRYAQTIINSTQIVNNTSNLLYQAGNSISLNPGFEVATGGVFESKIATCN